LSLQDLERPVLSELPSAKATSMLTFFKKKEEREREKSSSQPGGFGVPKNRFNL